MTYSTLMDQERRRPFSEDKSWRCCQLRLREGNLGEFARSYVNKNMALIAAPSGESFLLGDCPVVLANQNDYACWLMFHITAFPLREHWDEEIAPALARIDGDPGALHR